MPLPDNDRARALLIAGLFAATALALQLALRFSERADLMADQPGHQLLSLKAALFCIATGVLAGLDMAALASLCRRRPAD